MGSFLILSLYLYLLVDISTRVTFSHLQLNLSSWNCPFLPTQTILPAILPTHTAGPQHVHPTIPITMLYWPYALGICQASSFLSILTVTLLVAVASVFLSPITPLPLSPIHSLPYTKRKFCKWISDHINTPSRTMQWLPIAFVIKLKCLRSTYKYFMDSSHAFPASSPPYPHSHSPSHSVLALLNFCSNPPDLLKTLCLCPALCPACLLVSVEKF